MQWSIPNEYIIKVEEGGFKALAGREYGREYERAFEGYVVTTNRRRIKMGVSAGQDCCEVTGYFSSEDDPKSFIGKTLTGIAVVDTLLNKTQIKTIEYLDEGGVMFVNLSTPDDTLQFVVYNIHNGYYGHEALISVGQIDGEDEVVSRHI